MGMLDTKFRGCAYVKIQEEYKEDKICRHFVTPFACFSRSHHHCRGWYHTFSSTTILWEWLFGSKKWDILRFGLPSVTSAASLYDTATFLWNNSRCVYIRIFYQALNSWNCRKLTILYFNLVASLKIWETSDMKVWLGNLTTQNLPDKCKIFQLLEKQGKYLWVHLLVLLQKSDTVFERFSLNLYIGIFYWRTLNSRVSTGG